MLLRKWWLSPTLYKVTRNFWTLFCLSLEVSFPMKSYTWPIICQLSFWAINSLLNDAELIIINQKERGYFWWLSKNLTNFSRLNLYTKKYTIEGLTNDPENLNPYSKTYFSTLLFMFFSKEEKSQIDTRIFKIHQFVIQKLLSLKREMFIKWKLKFFESIAIDSDWTWRIVGQNMDW